MASLPESDKDFETIEVQAGIGSALVEKRREYAAHTEAMECMRLDMQMAQERARLAKAIAEADAAIADNRAVQAQMIATAIAARDLPNTQELDPSGQMPLAPAVPTQQPIATSPVDHKQTVKTIGVRLFRERSIAAEKSYQFIKASVGISDTDNHGGVAQAINQHRRAVDARLATMKTRFQTALQQANI